MATLTLTTAQSAVLTQTDTNLDSAYAEGLTGVSDSLLENYVSLDATIKPKVRNPFKSTAAALLVAMGSPTWTTITLNANWSNTNTTTYHPPSYTVTGYNTLKLRGHLTPSGGASATFATLPAGARPTKALTKVIPGATGVAILTITAAGAMSVSTVTNSADYSLDGLELDLT